MDRNNLCIKLFDEYFIDSITGEKIDVLVYFSCNHIFDKKNFKKQIVHCPLCEGSTIQIINYSFNDILKSIKENENIFSLFEKNIKINRKGRFIKKITNDTTKDDIQVYECGSDDYYYQDNKSDSCYHVKDCLKNGFEYRSSDIISFKDNIIHGFIERGSQLNKRTEFFLDGKRNGYQESTSDGDVIYKLYRNGILIKKIDN